MQPIPGEHPIFASYTGYAGPHDPEIWIDWIGARFPRKLFSPWPEFAGQERLFPPVGEEYFEWVDLLEAVANARGRFVMAELGAGWGRWGIRGARAARQRGLAAAEIVFVEAEPQHVAWMHECLSLNDIAGFRSTVVEGAISYAGCPVPFAIEAQGLNALTWYGQCIVGAPGMPTDRSYFGKPVFADGDLASIHVEPLTLEQTLAGMDIVDFLDADLQGAEEEMVLRGIDTLTARVRRVHIGTHGSAIEATIRSVFADAGWQPVWDFPSGQSVATPFGEVAFGDGVQGWINPQLSR